MEKSNQLNGLTIFRFVAAFYVFVFHCSGRFKLDMPVWLAQLIHNGAIGMSFFFVLSGFVLALASKDGIRKDYFVSRIKRIYPAYLFMGFLTLPFLNIYNWDKLVSVLFMFFTNTQSIIPRAFSEWNFVGSWSVSTEMFFYLMFPLVLPYIKKYPVISLVISYIAASVIMPLTMTISGSPSFPTVYSSPIHRFPEFAIGMALGCIYNNGFRIERFKRSMLLIAIALLVFISPIENYGWTGKNYITVIATGYLIYFLATANIKSNSFTWVFIYLGKISYSFYLMQIPLIIFIVRNKPLFYGIDSWKLWIAMASVNIIMAIFCYHVIEDRKNIKKIYSLWFKETQEG